MQIRFGAAAVLVAFVLSGVPSRAASPAPTPAAPRPDVPTSAPFAFDRTPGRLPKTVVPIGYDIHLAPDAATRRFHGSETVAVRVRESVREIVLNTNGLTVSRATVRNQTAVVRQDAAQQLTHLVLAGPIPAGPATVALAFNGTMGTSPEGLFVQPYRTADGLHQLISTELESTDARRVFPCWDEPSFRATFQLHVTLPQKTFVTSNMPAVARRTAGPGLLETTFARTPAMATYLLELSAGDLAAIEGSSEGTAIRVVAPRGREESGRYALASAEKILAYYNEYFGIRYPLPKLDLIAIPGGFNGAMENWGAITFRDNALLADPRATSLHERQEIFSILAHEMAHQWFGDLVTMAWWDDLWLNESFASWMSAKATDRFNPQWHWWEDQSADKERALGADAQPDVHPLQQHVVNETEAAAAFDPEITYSKGQAFLRMIETAEGEDAFRSGLRTYMRQHAYSNATSADLWNALQGATPFPVARIAPAWLTQPGYPVISVSATCENHVRQLGLTQTRFLAAGGTAPGLWDVPLHIRTGNGTVLRAQLTGSSGTVSAGTCNGPVVVNDGGVGYYRVQYAPDLASALGASFRTLSPDTQLAVLSDELALAGAGRGDIGRYLSLVSTLRDETDVAVWNHVRTAFATIARDERGRVSAKQFQSYERRTLRTLYDALPANAAADLASEMGQLRNATFEALGWNGDPQVVAEARSEYEGYRTGARTLEPSRLDAVLRIVGRNADAATWSAMHADALRRTDADLRMRYLTALAGVADDRLVPAALALATSGDIPTQRFDQSTRIVRDVAAAGHPEAAWAFTERNFGALTAGRADFSRAFAIMGLAESAWDAAPPAEITAFVAAHLPPDARFLLPRVEQTIAQRRAEQARIAPEVETALTTRRGND